jgi:hypothetical protein
MKPVIMLKGGRGKAGAQVAASHTGSLAGSRQMWEALSRQAVGGVVEGSRKTDKPLAVVLRKGRLGKGEEIVSEVQDDCFRAGLPAFGSFSSAARALGRYASYYGRRRQGAGER